MAIPKSKKYIIGRRDKVDLKELDLYEIDAKVDTGAYTSTIHCHDIKQLRKNGEHFVQFRLLDPNHIAYNHKLFELPVYTEKKIKNSFGQTEKRCIIQTIISIFDLEFRIQLSLTDRSTMGYPILLGRKALSKRFLVDVTKYNISHKQKVRNPNRLNG